jgi:cell division septal protein FtsQ
LWARSAEIEQRILNELPTLESVQVKCGMPARCAIVVVERQPKVLWEDGGVLWWIDAEGVVFQPPLSSFTEDGEAVGWKVSGPLPRDEQERLDKEVRIGLNELWATGKDVAQAFDYEQGLGLVFLDEQGWRVVLGQGSGMAKRLEVLERVTANLKAQGLTPSFVDVRFADAPYYSLKND